MKGTANADFKRICWCLRSNNDNPEIILKVLWSWFPNGATGADKGVPFFFWDSNGYAARGDWWIEGRLGGRLRGGCGGDQSQNYLGLKCSLFLVG